MLVRRDRVRHGRVNPPLVIDFIQETLEWAEASIGDELKVA